MSPDVQAIVASLLVALKLPVNIGQLTINLSDDGLVQSVESRQIFRRRREDLKPIVAGRRESSA